jgi:hypothetical protein
MLDFLTRTQEYAGICLKNPFSHQRLHPHARMPESGRIWQFSQILQVSAGMRESEHAEPTTIDYGRAH